MNYRVDVTREGDAWIADVPDLPGAHTFARNLVALNQAVREVIGLVADLPENAPIDVTYTYRGVDDMFLEATRLGEARAELEVESTQLKSQADMSVRLLTEHGYSVRDISHALRMSPGRVSQIRSRSVA
jgi:predicted RNase H-like HicB family nuclease